jgi:uncharacterized protein (DUF2062 family)
LTALVLGVLLAGAALVLTFGTVYARWTWRDRRRRRRRLDERRAQSDELERAMRRLRLNVG